MKALVVLLVIAVAVLSWELKRETADIARVQHRLDELSAQLSARPTSGSLELQAKCAEQAKKDYEKPNVRIPPIVWSHYEPSLSKCFVQTQMMDFNDPKAKWIHIEISDAFEGKLHAIYHVIKFDGSLPYGSGGKPTECRVTMPNGEDRRCESEEEFRQLAKTYMGAFPIQ